MNKKLLGDEIKQFLSPLMYSELNQQILKQKFDIFFIKQCPIGFRQDLASKLGNKIKLSLPSYFNVLTFYYFNI